ncbi:MAG: hypothetical protein ACR2KL_05010 [Nocardioidaceae bacterium]
MDFVGQRGHFGSWRLLCAAPAMLTSTIQVAILCALLGRYAILGLLVWLFCGFALRARQAERVAVRTGYRFRIPAGPDVEWLASVQEWASAAAGSGPGGWTGTSATTRSPTRSPPADARSP